MEYFEALNIEKRFANHLALDDVSIRVKEGSIFGLLGPNGAGKTTLIRIINRITAPDHGEVYIMGEKSRPEHVDIIGYLPEERGLYKKMKVGDQALYLARLKGLSRRDALYQLRTWFEKFDIMAWWDKKVEELSKGMQQKVQFIITVLHKPKLLIFDEPFSGFDPINTNLLKQEILKLKEEGSTILFSTHNMGSVEELCDSITLINKAKSILDGPVNEVRKRYSTNEYEIAFSGNFNLLQSTLTANYQLIEHKKTGERYTMRVRLLNNISSNQLLQTVMPCGNIISFNEIIPGMNDIFIRIVEEKNLSVEQES
ncbi:MAG: ATP-binding cassette domain-containing protein [Bacteroidota bacterium]